MNPAPPAGPEAGAEARAEARAEASVKAGVEVSAETSAETGAEAGAGEARPVKPWRRRLYVLGMALGLLLFGWQLAAAILSLRQSGAQIVAPVWLLGALALAALGYGLQLGGWLLIMRLLGCGLTPRNSFAGYFLSFLPRYVPGTVWGYLGRGEWLAQRHAVGYRTSSIGSLLEAGTFVATALAVGALAYLRAPWAWPAFGLLLAGAAAGWVILARLAGQSKFNAGRHRVSQRNSVSGARVSGWRRWGLLPAALVVYFCYWAVQGLSLGAVCRALGIGGDVDFLHLTAASATGWAAGFLTLFVPAGFGVRELSLTWLLTTQSGLPAADANLLAVLSRLCLIVAELLMLAAAVAQGGLGMRPAQKPRDQETEFLKETRFLRRPHAPAEGNNGPTAETREP